MAYSHCTRGNGTSTIGNNGSWHPSLHQTSVNILTLYYIFHLYPAPDPVPFPYHYMDCFPLWPSPIGGSSLLSWTQKNWAVGLLLRLSSQDWTIKIGLFVESIGARASWGISVNEAAMFPYPIWLIVWICISHNIGSSSKLQWSGKFPSLSCF